MAMTALFLVSASLPALAVHPDSVSAPDTVSASASAPAATDNLQSLGATSTGPAPVQRDGFTVTAAPEPPKPPPYTSSASSGSWASLDQNQLSDQGWALPVRGTISSSFGSRPNKPVSGVSGYHNATDIAASCGKTIFAATTGKVVTAGYHGSYGNWILIDHGDGIQTGYAHSSKLLVNEGDMVAAGEAIALVGTTGSSTGCHLHFETRINDTPVDAEPFMQARGVTLG
jgi:murein DD-endopeptidase MepM/ murein hydrolase activator NlpD